MTSETILGLKLLIALVAIITAIVIYNKRLSKKSISLLIILMLFSGVIANDISSFIPATKDEIVLTALKQNGITANSDQIFFLKAVIDKKEYSADDIKIKKGNWISDGSGKLAWLPEGHPGRTENISDSITIQVPPGQDRSLIFLSDFYCGLVQISSGNTSKIIDTSIIRQADLGPTPQSALSRNNNRGLELFLLYFIVLSVAAVFFVRARGLKEELPDKKKIAYTAFISAVLIGVSVYMYFRINDLSASIKQINMSALNFVIFFIAVLIVYYLIPNRVRWYWLLISSVVFFVLSCGWQMVPYLLYGVFVTWLGAKLIEESKTQKWRNCFLIITLALTISELFLLKYIGSLIGLAKGFIGLFDITVGGQTISLIAPIGISYYTLSLIGYVLDVYWCNYSAQKNVLKHTLFACYFPQLTSGPIMRYQDMNSQFYSEHSFDYAAVTFGFQRMLWGFFKKLVVANRISVIVNTVYANHQAYPGFYIVFATLCYALQLYADFSGCMDIMLGASQALRIKLPENFETPFASESIAVFWRRWHITLGLWFKDYMLYPILKSNAFQKLGAKSRKIFGKKKGKAIPTYFGLVILWLTIGLWHGGTAKYFVASGILPGIYLIMSEVLHPLFKKVVVVFKINTNCFSYRLFGRIRTLLLMSICWLFVCSTGFINGLQVIKSMISKFNPRIFIDGSVLHLGISGQYAFVLFAGAIMILIVDVLHEQGYHLRETIQRQNLLFRWFIWLAMFALIIYMGVYGSESSEFIYFKF